MTAVLRTKLKNIITGSTVQKTFQGSDKFVPVNLERKKAQYLYQDGPSYVFMEETSYEQFSFGDDIVGGAKYYIKEGDTVELQYYKGNPISLNVPIKVPLKVVDAPVTEKGNTVTAAYKTVKMETGLSVQAPMFIKEGDVLIVDTRDGSYVERSK